MIDQSSVNTSQFWEHDHDKSFLWFCFKFILRKVSQGAYIHTFTKDYIIIFFHTGIQIYDTTYSTFMFYVNYFAAVHKKVPKQK